MFHITVVYTYYMSVSFSTQSLVYKTNKFFEEFSIDITKYIK